jgi:UDP-N-acetylglucosamine transferase subunit ALG13
LIFVTVGQMLGFDRLIIAMDAWATDHPDQEVFAQIGDGAYVPNAMRWTRMVPPGEFMEKVRSTELIVAHAGMGTFFVAMEAQKPIVMMPRMRAKKEHTTDHQLHTLTWLREKPGVYAADSECDLPGAIGAAKRASTVFETFDRFAPATFVAKLRDAMLN